MTNGCLGFSRKYLIEASLMDLSASWVTFDSLPRCLALPPFEPVQCWLPFLIGSRVADRPSIDTPDLPLGATSWRTDG